MDLDQVNFCPPSLNLDDLLDRPFRYRKLEFKVASSQTDYLSILKLRKQSYISVGKIKRNLPLEHMACQTDRISRILMVWYKNKLIGSVSLTFPRGRKDTLDIERSLSAKKKSRISNKKYIMEISRLCIHRSYRGSGLFKAIISEIFRRALISGRRYIVTSASYNLLETYQKMGFRTTGIRYKHPDFAKIPHTILFMDLRHPISGWGISPRIWQRYYGRRSIHAPTIWREKLSVTHKTCRHVHIFLTWVRAKKRLKSWKIKEFQ